tara:strand:- start:40 stop:237 length:198 start_codon:yes stop_codon:yes gene_type:complete
VKQKNKLLLKCLSKKIKFSLLINIYILYNNQRNTIFRNKMNAIVKLKENKLFKTGILTGGNRKKD